MKYTLDILIKDKGRLSHLYSESPILVPNVEEVILNPDFGHLVVLKRDFHYSQSEDGEIKEITIQLTCEKRE